MSRIAPQLALTIRTLAALLLAMRLCGQEHPSQLWPQFRGPESSGIALGEHPYPESLDSDSLLWQVTVGPGHSSPCVANDNLFVTTYSGGTLELVCYATTDGTERWRRGVKVEQLERHHEVNSPASPSPATDGTRVVAYFGSFGLVCYSTDGEELWRRPVPKARNTFGTGASPIFARGKLVFLRDTNDTSVLEVLDPSSGEPLWSVDRQDSGSGWSTPVVWDNQGTAEILAYGAFRLTAYDFETGAERWSVPGLADEPCITPVSGDGTIFVTSYNMRTSPEAIGLTEWESLVKELDSDRNGSIDKAEAAANRSVLSRTDADGEGDHPLSSFMRWLDRDRDGELTKSEWTTIEKWYAGFQHANALLALRPTNDGGAPDVLWQQPRGVPECPSPLIVDGDIYLTKNGGIITCVDAATGEVHYHARMGARGPRYASPVATSNRGGLIYACSARGEVTVLRPGDELNVVSTADLKERIMATPALANGVVFIRTAQHIHAFGGAK